MNFPSSLFVTSRLGFAMGLMRCEWFWVELNAFWIAGDRSLTGTLAGSTLGGPTG